MNTLIKFSLIFVMILVSCGTSKTIIQSKKVMKGNWQLNSVKHNQTGTYNIKLLQDETEVCFEGSTWQFIPNNNSGLYSITDASCAVGERYFIFTIQEINAETGLYDFLLKPTSKLGKPDKEQTRGYRFSLVQLDANTMQWQQTVTVEGTPVTISLNFTKVE